MKREEFLAQPEVEAFVAWLVTNLPTLSFKLNFKSSQYVPGGLKAHVQGFEHVLALYRWKASWQDSNDSPVDSHTWAETRRSLGQLREWLTSAVKAGDEQQVLQACLQILRWGAYGGHSVFAPVGRKGRVVGLPAKDGRAHVARWRKRFERSRCQ